MMYEEFFGFNEQPFANAPNSRFYYNTTQHSHAVMRLKHAAGSMNGLTLLLGDIGAGKTTLARHMLEELPRDEYEIALLVIIHSQITAEWLLRKIAMQLGIKDVGDDKLLILQQLFRRLVEIYKSGKKTVVLIDESNMLQAKEIMEEIRGLLNMELSDRKLITFILFGLPETEKFLALDQPLYQRVAMKFRLNALKLNSTREYIKHRLHVAGGDPDLFNEEAINTVFEYSGGIPRLINILCENTLFSAFLMKTKNITSQLVLEVAEDFGLMPAEKVMAEESED